MSGLAVVVAGGECTAQVVPAEVAGADLVVAADSGLDLAYQLGLEVDALVGDLDSVSPGALARARDEGVPIEVSSADKDQTDLELALAWAVATKPNRLLVLGGAGGRLDHLLANLAVICGPITRRTETEAWIGTARVLVVRDRAHFEVAVGSVVSLLAWHGDASGVTTLGLRWPLRDALLSAGSALGTSNVVVAERAGVAVLAGVLSVVIERAATPADDVVPLKSPTPTYPTSGPAREAS
jgi:thiamine pyrophosphokinase